jgi:pyridoxal phosphate enzyme (YggS family)
MADIEGNVRRVLDTAAEAAIRSGRHPEEITVLAATKQNGPEEIRRALRAGIRTVGKNRVQELLEKQAAGAYGDARVEFIGTLQRNKVRQLVGRVALIQSAGSREVLEEISRRAAAAGLRQDVLLEINIGREDQKSGFFPEEADEAAAWCAELSGLRLCGVMTIPPRTDDPTEYFERMHKLFVDLQQKKYDNNAIRFLSMGMSADFAAAICAGANVVRIGTAIFGPRASAPK